ncbi:hypothetical protein DUNSADRAFT_6122 [Dunaliella salina]|uniref:Uncharacterized protein n=1 Tax=Dunaliella salina TaxID=3046 RepID=A0ABQ7H716_DUNSA|nr:hypothetical protein DUNSADRAFT_6122 [Dunaliella salina]|eukprot:KAF5842652.1 hypothetical protein DUNSADRAFT_6122 [Dunaliella salina]
MFKNSGTCVNIRAARSGQTQQQIVDNIHAILCQAVEHIPKKWANIQGVFLKTASSVALPLFQALPERQLRIDASKPAPASTPSTQAADGQAKSSKQQRAEPSARQGPSSKKIKS